MIRQKRKLNRRLLRTAFLKSYFSVLLMGVFPYILGLIKFLSFKVYNCKYLCYIQVGN